MGTHWLLDERPMGVVAYGGMSLAGIALMFVRPTFWIGAIVAVVPLVLLFVVHWTGIVADCRRKRIGASILIPSIMAVLVMSGGFQAARKFLAVDLTEPHGRYLFSGLQTTKADKTHYRPVIILTNSGQLPMRWVHAEGFVDLTTDVISRGDLNKEFNSALINLKSSNVRIVDEVAPGQNTAVAVGLRWGKAEANLIKEKRAMIYVIVAVNWKDDNVHGDQSITYEYCAYATGDLTSWQACQDHNVTYAS